MKEERRKLTEIAGVSVDQPETIKKKKQANYHPVSGYRIPPELADRVKQLANQLKVENSELAEVLLKYALKAVEEGQLKLEPTPEKYTLRR